MSFEEWVAEYHKQVETMLGEKIAADLWANEEQRNAVLESGYQSGLPPMMAALILFTTFLEMIEEKSE